MRPDFERQLGRIADVDTQRGKVWIERLVASPKSLRLLDKTEDIQTVDGAKFMLADGNSLHLRLSGNAPELRVYVESSSDAIFVVDTATSQVYYNRKFLDMFGYSREELAEHGGAERLYTDPEVARSIKEAVGKGRSWSGEVEMISRAGMKLAVLLRADSIRGDSGDVTGFISIHTDITDTKWNQALQSALYRIAEEMSRER